MQGVTVSKLISKMKLKNATPEQDTDKTVLTHPEVNRPALQLAGFSTILTMSGCEWWGRWSGHTFPP